MKYAVTKIINGTFTTDSEWDEKEKAYARFHTICASLYNSAEVITACVSVVDEKMNTYKMELIGYNA